MAAHSYCGGEERVVGERHSLGFISPSCRDSAAPGLLHSGTVQSCGRSIQPQQLRGEWPSGGGTTEQRLSFLRDPGDTCRPTCRERYDLLEGELVQLWEKMQGWPLPWDPGWVSPSPDWKGFVWQVIQTGLS